MAVAKKEEIITLAEASDILGFHPNTLRKWDNKGFLKAIRFGPRKDRRYKKSDILLMLKKE
jgi:DNA-binding transcriptional MerR regulator